MDKPSGPTSHDVVDRVRRATGQRRVGHAGTLDPLASGLLPVVLGCATRLVRFLPGSPKVYMGSFRLGIATDTDDVTGRESYRHRGALPAPEAVLEAAGTMLGPQRQVPPRFSARKVGGRRLYALAREGASVTGQPTAVEIFCFDLSPTGVREVYDFTAGVSAGTYVRALVRDLGLALGCGAALRGLRRTRIGPMSVEQAVAAPPRVTLDRSLLVPPERMPLEPPTFCLERFEDEQRFSQGNAIPVEGLDLPEGYYRVSGAGGRLLGVAEKEGGRMRPRVVLNR